MGQRMLEIVQAGQVGKTGLLFDMHRLRKRVFKDRLGWDVQVTASGLEVDAFDLPDTVYLLAISKDQRVIGSWRLLPTTGTTMVHDLWPHFLENLPLPRDRSLWEVSRFAVDCPLDDAAEAKEQAQHAIQEMFCGLTELCLLCGIQEVVTLYDMRLARLLQRLDCHPRLVSPRQRVGDVLCQVGAFVTDAALLEKLRKATGLNTPLIHADQLPPALQPYLLSQPVFERISS